MHPDNFYRGVLALYFGEPKPTRASDRTAMSLIHIDFLRLTGAWRHVSLCAIPNFGVYL